MTELKPGDRLVLCDSDKSLHKQSLRLLGTEPFIVRRVRGVCVQIEGVVGSYSANRFKLLEEATGLSKLSDRDSKLKNHCYLL